MKDLSPRVKSFFFSADLSSSKRILNWRGCLKCKPFRLICSKLQCNGGRAATRLFYAWRSIASLHRMRAQQARTYHPHKPVTCFFLKTILASYPRSEKPTCECVVSMEGGVLPEGTQHFFSDGLDVEFREWHDFRFVQPGIVHDFLVGTGAW